MSSHVLRCDVQVVDVETGPDLFKDEQQKLLQEFSVGILMYIGRPAAPTDTVIAAIAIAAYRYR